MNKKELIVILMSAGAAPLACSGGTEPGAEPVSRARSPVSVSATGLPQYVHSLACSRIALGPNETSVPDGALTKLRGDWGSYVLDTSDGHEYGAQRKGSPLLVSSPYGASVVAHGQAVLHYFESCGLPSAEVGQVLPRVGGRMLGRAGESPQPVGPQMYYSAVSRAVNGIPIVDSFAWARMAESGDIVREEVYWPAIPQDVIDAAIALQAQLAATSGATAFRAGLPAGTGRVTIRHSSPWAPPGMPFEAFAVYDITTSDGHGSSQTHHFDAHKNEIRLAQESWPAPTAGKP